MKILGHTPEGDLIIQVSQGEWDRLQDGIKPEGDEQARELRSTQWEKTETGLFYSRHRKPRLRNEHKFRYMFIKGEFNGTISQFVEILNTRRISNMGETYKVQIFDALKADRLLENLLLTRP